MQNGSKIKNSVKFIILLIFTAGFLTNIAAQERKLALSNDAVENINNGIESDNPGLRNSAINLVGKFQVNESVESLVKQLKIESRSQNRIAIVKSLYLLGDEEYMPEIRLVSQTDPDLNVREFASAVYTLMGVERTLSVSSIN